MKRQPPYNAIRFLRWFCKDDYIEEIEGDLIELFDKRLTKSTSLANSFFWWNVIKSFHYVNIKKVNFLLNKHIMFSSYIKIGFRNIIKDFNFSVLNLLGLSLGLAVFVIMILTVNNEYSYDHFHSKGDRIFEVIQEFQNADGNESRIFTSLKLSKALKEEMPNVKNAVTVHSASPTWMEVNGNRFFEENGIVAGTEFFEIFDFKLKYGEKEQVLKQEKSIVLEESLALKLFGTDNPIGEIVDVERYGSFKVTGILEKIPSNSYIQFDFIITQYYDVYFTRVASWFPSWFQSWNGNGAATFIELHDASKSSDFSKDIVPILKKNLNSSNQVNPHYLVNIHKLHFESNNIRGSVNEFVKGDIKQIRLLGIVAFLILFMACFNYVNISTARSINRTKEVGIRKSIGAKKNQISQQFLTESFLQVALAFFLSIGWVYLLLPYFSSITGINYVISTKVALDLLPFIVVTVLLVSLFAGFYPALFLSRFSPIKVLKNSTISVKGNSLLRNGLITIQYTLVIIMLASLLIIHNQFKFMTNKNLGFDTENLLIVEVNGGGVRNNYQSLKNELLSNPKIKNVTGLTRMISGYRSPVSVFAVDNDNPDQRHSMRFYGMDQDGPTTLGLNIKLGEHFSGIESLDSASVYLNETAAALYGGEKIVGEWINLIDESDERYQLKARVLGIIEDFHHQSLHEHIAPVVIGYYINPFEGLDDIVIKMKRERISETLSFIETTHNKYDENDVMTWKFMDDMVQSNYEKETTFRGVFLGASIVSFIITLLGMVGLISYNVLAKTKEFGIRKVLGANYVHLISMQGKNFISFILIATVSAVPIAWWLASSWLDNYAFRIQLTPYPFILAFITMFVCTTITLWLINHKSIRKKPVEALRYE